MDVRRRRKRPDEKADSAHHRRRRGNQLQTTDGSVNALPLIYSHCLARNNNTRHSFDTLPHSLYILYFKVLGDDLPLLRPLPGHLTILYRFWLHFVKLLALLARSLAIARDSLSSWKFFLDSFKMWKAVMDYFQVLRRNGSRYSSDSSSIFSFSSSSSSSLSNESNMVAENTRILNHFLFYILLQLEHSLQILRI